MIEIGYDAKRLPLGKLSENNIQTGFKILKKIIKILNKNSKIKQFSKEHVSLEELSEDFYSYIPHDYGMQKMY